MKYKNLEEKIDEALKLSKETGVEQKFNVCQSGEDITATNESKCPETKLGSFQIYPENKDAAPSKDITNIQPDVQKV
jgi:hypothetical protein